MGSTPLSQTLTRIAGGVAVLLWGVSKLVFVQDWAMPYGMFYASASAVSTSPVTVYILGGIQVLLGIGILAGYMTKQFSWIAFAMATLSILATLVIVSKAGLSILEKAPAGLQLIWFITNPVAIALLLLALALAPSPRRI